MQHRGTLHKEWIYQVCFSKNILLTKSKHKAHHNQQRDHQHSRHLWKRKHNNNMTLTSVSVSLITSLYSAKQIQRGTRRGISKHCVIHIVRNIPYFDNGLLNRLEDASPLHSRKFQLTTNGKRRYKWCIAIGWVKNNAFCINFVCGVIFHSVKIND